MASSYTLNSVQYGDYNRRLQLTCSQTRNVVANTSSISWTLTVLGGSSSYYSTGPTTVKINGTTVYSKSRVEWDELAFPAGPTNASTSGSLTVNHSTDGTKSVSVSIETAIYSYSTTTTSGTWTLDSIDRTAPTISSLTSSGISATGFTFSATANVACNWQYSTNGGSTWASFGTNGSTSASKTLTNLNPATTYNITVRATKVSNEVASTSTISVATLGYATLTTAPNCNVDTATNFTYDVKATGFYYKLFFYNGSSNIKTVTIGGGKSVGSNTQSVTIEGNLLPNATSATITARLITYTSSAYNSEVGRSEKTFTLSVPNTAGYQPSVSIAVEPVNTNNWIKNTATYKYWGGFTAVKITLTRTANGGATVSSYGVTSPSVTTVSTGVYQTAVLGNGIQTIRATITDSRGRTATASTTVTMATYSAPSVSNLSSTRGTYSGGTWTADENGNHIRVYSTPVCSLTNYGNAVTQTVSISGQSAPTQSGNYYYFTGTSGNSSYTVNVALVDSTNTSSTFTLNVPSIAVPFNLNPLIPAAAFGKVAEETNTVEIAPKWNLHAQGRYNRFEYMPYSWSTAGGADGTDGYVRVVTITLKNSAGYYPSAPIRIEVSRRYDFKTVNLYLEINSTDGTTFSIRSFTYDYAIGAYEFSAFAVQNGNAFDIYVKKGTAWAWVDVWTYMPAFMSYRADVSYVDHLRTSVPSGATMATPVPPPSLGVGNPQMVRFNVVNGTPKRITASSECALLISSTGWATNIRSGLWFIAGYNDSSRADITTIKSASAISITGTSGLAWTITNTQSGTTADITVLALWGEVPTVT